LLVTVLENFADLGHPDVPSVVTNEVPNGVSNGVTNGITNGFTSGIDGHEKSSNTDHQVDVVVIGAGQCGLALGGRLAALGINYVVLEKRPSVGNNWTQRYESVRQHTVREYNNLPFERTWKSNDPLLLPGKIVAEGFENYVNKYKINLWTNANTTGSTWDPKSRTWTLEVVVNGEEKRKLVCRHLAIAIGAGVSVDNDPKFPGTDQYRGIIQHSGAYKHSRDWTCKDGIVIGTGTTAHDIAQDMYRASLRSITMIQRSKTAIYPIEWVVKGQEGKKLQQT
jgi:cation diffusion facilitator CzcD-associated flavoprotein CzcO